MGVVRQQVAMLMVRAAISRFTTTVKHIHNAQTMVTANCGVVPLLIPQSGVTVSQVFVVMVLTMVVALLQIPVVKVMETVTVIMNAQENWCVVKTIVPGVITTIVVCRGNKVFDAMVLTMGAVQLTSRVV